VVEAVGQQRQPFERVALHHLRVERREQRGSARHALDGLAVVVEQRDADRVDARRLAQRLEVALDAAVATLAGETLEVDRDLGGEHVEPDRRAAAAAKNDLRGEEVRPVLTVAALGWGDRHLARLDPCCLPQCVSLVRTAAELLHSFLCSARQSLARHSGTIF
jgi:hypothetical protein